MWLRHLIQQNTGYWTGSIKSSDKLVKIGWAGERLGQGFVNFYKNILILRMVVL